MNEKTIISLSFDDGREDLYRIAFQIMKKYNLVGTAFVTTGYVDGTWTSNWKTAMGPITITQLKEMYDFGFEISSHGDRHITDKEDLLTSLKKMKSWSVVDNKIGFSIPCSSISERDKTIYSEFLEAHSVVYMRGGRDRKCYTLISKIYFALYQATKSNYFYSLFNRHNCINNSNQNIKQYNLPAVVIRKEDKAETIVDLINKNRGCWIVFMFHGIQYRNESHYGKDAWCWDAEEFEKLCLSLSNSISNNEISVMPILEVITKFKRDMQLTDND